MKAAARLIPFVKDAMPVCVAVAIAATIGLVDVHLAGALGPAVQAGVGIGDQFLFFAALVGTGIAQGAGSLIARATGAANEREANSFAKAGILLSLMLGVSSSVITYFSADCLLGLFSQDPNVQNAGATYLKLCTIANTPYCLMLIQSAILRASGKSFSTIFPWFVAAAISITLSISLPLIMPNGAAYQLEYIALGWNVGAIVAALIGQNLLKKLGVNNQVDSDFRNKSMRILRLGLPIAATEAAWLSSNFAMYIILSQMPFANETQAAWTIRLKIEEIVATPAILAFSMTAASLVGQRIGAGDIIAARQTSCNASIAAAAVMFVVGLIVFANSEWLATDYATTALSAQFAQQLLVASVVVFPITAFYMTMFGALEGAGSTLKPMLSVLGGLFLFRIPLAAWIGLFSNGGMNGVVVSIIASQLAVALSAVSQGKSYFETNHQPIQVENIARPLDQRV